MSVSSGCSPTRAARTTRSHLRPMPTRRCRSTLPRPSRSAPQPRTSRSTWTWAAGSRTRPARSSILTTRRIRNRLNTRFAPHSTRSRTTTTTATTIMQRRGVTDPAPITKPRSESRCGAFPFQPFRRLAVDPVRQLHQEAVVGPQIEQIAQIAAERARSLDTRPPHPALAPHNEECRPRPVLPPEHDVRAELLEVEPADADRVRLIATRIVFGARRRRELSNVAERPLRDEGLGIDLQRHVRIERIGEARRQPELLLLEMRKQVVGNTERVPRAARLGVVCAA